MPDADRVRVFSECLLQIIETEARTPGCVQALYRTDGIVNFRWRSENSFVIDFWPDTDEGPVVAMVKYADHEVFVYAVDAFAEEEGASFINLVISSVKGG